MGTIIKLDSVQDYNELLGVETVHPLVSVVDFSELESVRHCLKNFGFYCILIYTKGRCIVPDMKKC